MNEFTIEKRVKPRAIIEKRNTGMAIIEKQFNTKYEYIAGDRLYIENDDVIVEDCGKIDIYTKISNHDDLDIFIEALRRTDIFELFETIEIHLNINNFYNGENYITIKHTHSYQGKIVEEYYSVFIHTK